MRRGDAPVQRRCEQVWSQLKGVGATRHCDVCDAPVTNLSLLTERAARAVLARGPQCIAYRYRVDGTVVFSDPRTRTPRRFGPAGVALLLVACGGDDVSSEAAAEPVTAEIQSFESAESGVVERTTARDPDTREACRRLLGAERRAENRREMAEEEQPLLDCDLMRQLQALGGYGAEIPAHCEEE